MQACELYGNKYFEGKWFPKFTVIVAQKNHHTRFFLPNEHKRDDVINVSPGNLHPSSNFFLISMSFTGLQYFEIVRLFDL